MPVEAQKYNLKNFTPDKFMVPPTAPVRNDLLYLANHLRAALEGDRFLGREVRIGTELEILFFDPTVDPIAAKQKWGRTRDNPNYSYEHHGKMALIRKWADDLSKYQRHQFLAPTQWNVMFELRTAPQKYQDHLKTIDFIQNDIAKLSQKLDVRPVVYSQHIHVSAARRVWRKAFLRDLDIKGKVGFSKILPLVVLPEEFCGFCARPSMSRPDLKSNAIHPEFRLLSSEYAHDPALNLLLVLRGLYTELVDSQFATDIQVVPKTYDGAVEKMKEDKELAAFFGQSVLATLAQIVSHYPQVSTREITVDEINRV